MSPPLNNTYCIVGWGMESGLFYIWLYMPFINNLAHSLAQIVVVVI